jgi:hypothetical protein
MFCRPSATSPRTEGVATAPRRRNHEPHELLETHEIQEMRATGSHGTQKVSWLSRLSRVSCLLWLSVSSIAAAIPAAAPPRVEILKSVGGIPPQIVGEFQEPASFQRASNGQYFVFDRRAHTVYGIDAKRTAAWKLIQIGQETGRVIEPSAFDLAPNGTFAIADAPRGQERVQIFGPGGNVIGGFTLRGRLDARVAIGSLVLNGVGSLQYTGTSFLIGQPETGALFTEYSPSGSAMRTIGRLRPTGFEQDRDLHVAMNTGMAIVDPTGGFYFVFLAGTPMFRKYADNGDLVFERHIEGRELDEHLRNMPTRWPRRRVEDREVPFVAPTVRAAAADAKGQLWISLVLPYTFVYDGNGDKMRTVQFQAAGIVAPTSLFFTPGGSLLVTPGCYEFRP